MSKKITERQSILRILIVFALLVIVLLIGIRSKSIKNNTVKHVGNDTISLFNGHDLNNWRIVLKDSLAPLDSTFFVDNGTIFCTGKPFGYLRTKDTFSSFRLLVDWSWVGEPGNSGVFLFVNQDKIFPDCLECQLQHGQAGDFIATGDVDFREKTDKTNIFVNKMKDSSEKPAGEWNTYDIRVLGDSVSIYVNGVLQNIASHLTKTSGSIALQSEGAPIRFRNIKLIRKD